MEEKKEYDKTLELIREIVNNRNNTNNVIPKRWFYEAEVIVSKNYKYVQKLGIYVKEEHYKEAMKTADQINEARL